MNVLVTGINGFVGHHVARCLFKSGHTIVGLGMQSELEQDLRGVVGAYQAVNLLDEHAVAKLSLNQFQAIINLAGLTKVGDSKGQADVYNDVNVKVHTNLYEECLRQGARPRIIAVSSGTVYAADQPLPLNEQSRLVAQEKTNEYTASKLLMEIAVRQFNDRGLECIITRPFNHSGPGQLPGFLIPDLGEQIYRHKTEAAPLRIGNLSTKRDYTDVRDVAQAYTLLATLPSDRLKHNTYNICSGKSVSGSYIFEKLCAAFDLGKVDTQIDPLRIRDNDIMDLYGSHELLHADTGWEPTISVEKMVSDYVDWRLALPSDYFSASKS